MIALSIALVLCCAMVCGTRVWLRRIDLRRSEVARDGAEFQTLQAYTAAVESDVKALRAEVDALKASAAFRSLGRG